MEIFGGFFFFFPVAFYQNLRKQSEWGVLVFSAAEVADYAVALHL